MSQLVGLIVTHDEEFKKRVGRMLRSGPIPVGLIDERVNRDISAADIVVVDIRGDGSSALGSIERLRAAAQGASVFAVAQANDPDLILQSIRVAARRGIVRRSDSSDRLASRDHTGSTRGGEDTRLLWRKGWRRDDDDRGQLRRGALTPEQALERHRGPQGRSW